MKSSVDEIRARFDQEVERFSNLETGQSATVDAPLALELIAEAAAVTNPQAKRLLDVGCGAGNYTLKLLQKLPNLDVTLVDLSRPMLDKAEERIRGVKGQTLLDKPAVAPNLGGIHLIQGDIRQIELGLNSFDIILAAAVLHHLRSDDQWISIFIKFYRAMAPGGSLWVFDLIDSELPSVRKMMQRRYGEYLESLKGPEYRQQVFDYVEKEDTPRPLMYQLDLLRSVGFRTVEVLHKNSCFAAFGAVK